MRLKELLSLIDYSEKINRSGIDSSNTEISLISSYSDTAKEGAIFVCITGSMVDGHTYAKDAYANGCRCFVSERRIDVPDDSYVIIVKDSRIALAQLSAAFFDYPAKKMTLIGITGTKGKTTSSLLI